jgi:hypothetical protein
VDLTFEVRRRVQDASTGGFDDNIGVLEKKSKKTNLEKTKTKR